MVEYKKLLKGIMAGCIGLLGIMAISSVFGKKPAPEEEKISVEVVSIKVE